MSTLYFRIMDVGHGVMTAMLLYFICRLLLIRREGTIRVRYVAAIMMLLTMIQTTIYFLMEESERITIEMEETISVWMDLIANLGCVFMLWLLIRNRRIFPKKSVWVGCGLLLCLILGYLLCACFMFADWTYSIYLPLSTIVWGLFGYTIDRLIVHSASPTSPENISDQWDGFRKELSEVMQRDRLFCREDLTREDVCRLMCTNRTTLNKHISAAYGKTFSEYLRDMRLEESARLLRETDMPIDQIAYEVGLKSASGFHRNFLFTYGMTPKQYRNNSHSK